jgi:hypothetical protein
MTTNKNDRDILLELHQKIIQCHIDGNVDEWLSMESDDFVAANRGDILHPSKQDRANQREPYLSHTTFKIYKDVQPPIVNISDDGTLGWLIAQVEVSGTQQIEDKESVDFSVVWAWIELYEKQDGEWLCVGNVSNAKP